MKYGFAGLALAALAAPAAAQDLALNLELSCAGRYLGLETTSATISQPGELPDRASVTKAVLLPGTARVSFRGSGGEITYPDGEQRALTNVVADAQRITATYTRRGLLLSTTWRLEISRTTGDIRVASNADVSFIGTCEPVSTKPKF